jgi:hypothetical protein
MALSRPPIAERRRLAEAGESAVPWRKWGPYLSERQWGTVREDYSGNGDAWNYFTHDQARSRTYRWGEDGLAGFSDDKQFLCFALALWNGVDPILKERLFGLTNSEGNHGEDVKEYYFYLDSTPTHSYMKWLYKYPQRAYPYLDLIETNKKRGRSDLEYELIDTGIFNDDRYYDVFAEYAKASPEEILIKITVWNRGSDAAKLHLLPHFWFRNQWRWDEENTKPEMHALPGSKSVSSIVAAHQYLGQRYFHADGAPQLLFTDNETNDQKVFGQPNPFPFLKDGINDYVVQGKHEAVNPQQTGTKAAAYYVLDIPAGQSREVRLRISEKSGINQDEFGKVFDDILKARRAEADEFYESITPPNMPDDARNVMRQALAGMLWSKQYYYFDLQRWIDEHELFEHRAAPVRNADWTHMLNDDIISMPDKWEYPWYAAWDLAFHTRAFSMIDPDFARAQLGLMLHDMYLHPNGQLPAYEWNFGDVNPPVHAWAAYELYDVGKTSDESDNLAFLQLGFAKLLLNFTWWVNRKDLAGDNVFEGGFLGLDNIGVFDRSQPLPTGGYIEQADGTAWMAFYCLNMLMIALELEKKDPNYGEFVVRFTEHFFRIAGAMDRIGEQEDELWDEQDGFFYDLLKLPDGRSERLKVRSIVGLLPLFATAIVAEDQINRIPEVVDRIGRFIRRNPELLANISDPSKPGQHGRRLLSVLNEKKLRRVLARMLDENEFLSDYGIRSLSRYHLDHPFVMHVDGQEFRVRYVPAESDSGLFGGNSNWRGPIWMPVNLLLLRGLGLHYLYYGDYFKVECPTGSGKLMNLYEVAQEIARRLMRIFFRNEKGQRPVYGGTSKFQTDPYWKDLILFYEYFHGDIGAGIGASHQTGWTGVISMIIQMFGGYLKPEDLMNLKDATRLKVQYERANL